MFTVDELIVISRGLGSYSAQLLRASVKPGQPDVITTEYKRALNECFAVRQHVLKEQDKLTVAPAKK